jgi:hypothetical protein
MASEQQASSPSRGTASTEQISSLTEEAGAKLGDATETAQKQARSFAEQQKTATAEQLRTVAGAVRRTARDLETELPRAAGIVDDAAGRIDSAATALGQRSIDDLMAPVGRFAREQPAAFFGSAILGGFALARFLKSSGEGAQRRDQM